MQAPLRPRWRNPAWLATSDQWQCCWKWCFNGMIVTIVTIQNAAIATGFWWWLAKCYQWCFNLAFQNAENDGFLMVSNGQITEVWGCFWGTHLVNWSSVWASHWSYPTRPCFGYIAASATSSHPKNIFITTTFLWSHVPNKKHPQLNSDLNWPRPICLNWLIHQFWYPKWDSPKMTQFCWSHSFEIVAPLWLRTSDSSAMVPVWVLSIGSFVETRCAYVYACMCIWLLIKIPLSGKKCYFRETFANSMLISFAEPMLGNHDIHLSRNFCETKCYFRELEKKTFERVSNITRTAFAIKTPCKDL